MVKGEVGRATPTPERTSILQGLKVILAQAERITSSSADVENFIASTPPSGHKGEDSAQPYSVEAYQTEIANTLAMAEVRLKSIVSKLGMND